MYSYVIRANYKVKDKMRQMIDWLNDGADESDTYSLVKNKRGYAVKLEHDDGVNSFTDYASVVKCNNCGGLRELFDGQIEFCYHCDEDW
jgi:hypothetical protein